MPSTWFAVSVERAVSRQADTIPACISASIVTKYSRSQEKEPIQDRANQGLSGINVIARRRSRSRIPVSDWYKATFVKVADL
jgi:hypothetical protein